MADEWRSVWQLARLSITAVSTARLTAFCSPLSAVWERHTTPVCRSGLKTTDGKTRLPSPLCRSGRVLAVERVRQRGTTVTFAEVPLVELTDALEVVGRVARPAKKAAP